MWMKQRDGASESVGEKRIKNEKRKCHNQSSYSHLCDNVRGFCKRTNKPQIVFGRMSFTFDGTVLHVAKQH